MTQSFSNIDLGIDKRADRPYPPSWVDRLTIWIDSLPGPAWAFYVVLTVVIILVSHLLRWIDGSVTVGEIDNARVAEGPLALVFLALIHYLNTVAKRSLSDFRPALVMSDSEYNKLEYELTTMPSRLGLLSGGVGMLLGIFSVFSDPVGWGIYENTSTFVSIYVYIFAAIIMASGGVFFVHIIRQLRLVNRIHQNATEISLFKMAPLYAFSALTVRTGIGIVMIVYYFVYLTYSLNIFGSTSLTAIDMGLFGIMLLVATASFILPLNGMHRRLVKEKNKLISETDLRFEATISKIHHLMDSDNFEKIGELNNALSSLVIERESLAKMSTWPWKPETLRGFLTSVALPVILWFITTYLGRFLEQ
jgi:hypothetical protein